MSQFNLNLLNDDEIVALRNYMSRWGRYWKDHLRHDWQEGSFDPVLQHLRNASYFGPAGLNLITSIQLAG